MSDLDGNPKDRFSHVVANIKNFFIVTANDKNLKQVRDCMTALDNKPFDAVTVNMSKLVIDLFIDSLTYPLWDSLID